MPEIRLGEVESRFADIIWQNEPLSSGELARLAEAELGFYFTQSDFSHSMILHFLYYG